MNPSKKLSINCRLRCFSAEAQLYQTCRAENAHTVDLYIESSECKGWMFRPLSSKVSIKGPIWSNWPVELLPIPQNSDKAEVSTKARPVSKDWRPISIVLREDISHLTKKGPTWSKCRAHMALEVVTGKENEKKHCASHIRQVPSEYSLRFQVRWTMKVQNAWAVQISLFCWNQIDQSKYIYIIFDYIFIYYIYISSSLINCWNISRDSPCTRTTRGLRFAEVPEVLAIQPAVMPRQDRWMSAVSLEKLDKSWVEQSLNTDWTNMNELRYERNIVNQFPCKFFAGNKHKRSNRSHVDARRTMPNIHRLTPRVPRVIMAPHMDHMAPPCCLVSSAATTGCSPSGSASGSQRNAEWLPAAEADRPPWPAAIVWV